MPIPLPPPMPTDLDAEMARQTSTVLAPLVASEGKAHLHIRAANNQEADLDLPAPALHLLLSVLQELGRGNGVTITPIQREYTTQQAANFLQVSRPFLIEELLEQGKLPYRKVGNRRRIRHEDLVRYRDAEEVEIARREAVMRELMEESERLGLYR